MGKHQMFLALPFVIHMFALNIMNLTRASQNVPKIGSQSPLDEDLCLPEVPTHRKPGVLDEGFETGRDAALLQPRIQRGVRHLGPDGKRPMSPWPLKLSMWQALPKSVDFRPRTHGSDGVLPALS